MDSQQCNRNASFALLTDWLAGVHVLAQVFVVVVVSLSFCAFACANKSAEPS